MHTKFCEHGDGQDDLGDYDEAWRAWWPQGSPSEVDVSTLVASANDISTPTRLPPIEGNARWLGIWGNYAGLRIGFSPAESFQAMSPCVVAYPEGVDLYLSRDTGGAGIATLGRFQSRAAALAFCGSRPSSTTKVPPGSASFTPSDTQANPTGLVGVENFAMVWDITDALWVRWEARTPNDALPLRNIPEVIAENALFDATANVYKRAQQLPNTSTGRAKQEDAWLPIRASTGTISAAAASNTTVYTVPAGKIFRLNWFNIYSVNATTAGAGSALQILGGTLTQSIVPTPTAAANVNLLNAAGMGATFVAGDTVVLGVVGATGAGNIAMTISGEERYAE